MEETPWLDEQERAAWRALIGVTLLLPTALDAQLQRDAGVTHFDYLVLVVLSESDQGMLPMSTLAARASSSLSRLSHVVSKLEKRGWIERRRSAADARTTIAELTAAGRAELAAAAPGHVATVRALVLDGLSAEQLEQLGSIAATLLGTLDPQHRFAPED